MGSCEAARWNATPALNPTITDSETKETRLPAFAAQAANARMPTIRAVIAARAAWRVGSPPSKPASDVPIRREIADVTVTAVCFELQKSQNIMPAKRQA